MSEGFLLFVWIRRAFSDEKNGVVKRHRGRGISLARSGPIAGHSDFASVLVLSGFMPTKIDSASAIQMAFDPELYSL